MSLKIKDFCKKHDIVNHLVAAVDDLQHSDFSAFEGLQTEGIALVRVSWDGQRITFLPVDVEPGISRNVTDIRGPHLEERLPYMGAYMTGIPGDAPARVILISCETCGDPIGHVGGTWMHTMLLREYDHPAKYTGLKAEDAPGIQNALEKPLKPSRKKADTLKKYDCEKCGLPPDLCICEKEGP